MRTLSVAIALGLGASHALGQSVEAVDVAANNLSHEAAICLAYYSFAAHCIGRSPGQTELSRKYNEMAGHAKMIMETAGELAGVSEQAHAARVEMALQAMKAATDNSCTNISVLLADHSHSCLLLLEQPEARYFYWLGKADQ
jgi:hypothetical protein